MRKIPLFLLIAGILTACGSLEQEFEIELPPHERQLNIEGYVVADLPFWAVLVSETVGYFEEFTLPAIRDAEVVITYKGEEIPLQALNDLQLDSATLALITGATGFANVEGLYVAPRFEEIEPNVPIALRVIDPQGRQATAQTFVPPVVPIDTAEAILEESNGKYYLLTSFDDPAGERNYYRRILQERYTRVDSTTDGVDSSRQTRVLQKFAVNDDLQDGQRVTFGTFPDFEPGDTLITTIYSIPQHYYDYLTTVDAAINANLGPFAPPSRILSNVQGGIGIFTGVSVSERIVVIE